MIKNRILLILYIFCALTLNSGIYASDADTVANSTAESEVIKIPEESDSEKKTSSEEDEEEEDEDDEEPDCD